MSTSNPNKKPHPAQATYDANREARQSAFLEAYKRCGNISAAANAVGISPVNVYQSWRSDPDFVSALELATEVYADYMEDLARQKIETMNPKHDTMHMQQLNALRPKKYRPEIANHTVNDNRSVTIVHNYHHSVSEPQATPIPTDSSHELPPKDADSRHKDTTESVIDTDSESSRSD